MADLILSKKNRFSHAAFWLGTAAVAFGVLSHIPMFIEAAPNDFKMAGMPMSAPTLWGMAAIVAGTLLAAYGLLPATFKQIQHVDIGTLHEISDGRLTKAHGQLLAVLMAALVIDMMKPATLGFVVPGIMKEYGIAKPIVAWLPFCGLTGTTIGSWIWGILADRIGRRAAILLAAILFIGTSICGAMPTFGWNLAMCFMMGLSAGGMLPIAYTLLAETIPAKHRGWSLVLIGGVGLIGGYFASSGLAHLLEPLYGWRILWLVGLPTGLLLIFFNRFIPESPRFLLMNGRREEALDIMARFGTTMTSSTVAPTHHDLANDGARALIKKPLLGKTLALNFAAFAWSLVNFGILLWMPADLKAAGYEVGEASKLLFASSLLALPACVITAWIYSQWSTKGTLVLMSLLTAVGLLSLSLLGTNLTMLHMPPIVVFAVLLTGSNGIIAVLLPYTAESYPLYIRGRSTGLVAGSSKLGGVVAQIVNMLALVPPLATAGLTLAGPIMIGAALVARMGGETRNRDLEELDK